MPAPVLVLESLESLETDETTGRILDGALASWSRFGVGRTTLDDVAREAGCSRATVYRHFANRTALVTAVVERELDALTEAVLAAAAGESDLEDAVVAMYLVAAHRIGEHVALQRVLDLEPEVILPSLSFEGGSRLLAEAGNRFAPAFVRFVPPERATRAAEWCTRVLLAYLHPDRSAVSMTDRAAVRALVRRHVIPAVSPRSVVPTR
jgi:AcrR family transcriptional regulator